MSSIVVVGCLEPPYNNNQWFEVKFTFLCLPLVGLLTGCGTIREGQ
jgi:hypothetical protein